MPKIGPRYRVQFRRKREGKTDYRRRLRLLRSGVPRLVTRISLKHTITQVVRATPVGDMTLASAHSKQLGGFGWKGHTSNIPTAYLVGLLCGYRAVKAGVKECALDIGAHNPTRQAKVFAILKGALDAGLQIPHEAEVLPPEDRIKGTHISRYAAELKEKNAKGYQARFSGYLARGLPPERISEHFNEIRQAIITKFGG
ncbi:MAG: 50S ribosomal protein L18 [Candidatus Hodarchaeaceae archaeon]|nr:50S ribosomal protein L18 [Candidatus Hodarchaeaceae archaeon]